MDLALKGIAKKLVLPTVPLLSTKVLTELGIAPVDMRLEASDGSKDKEISISLSPSSLFCAGPFCGNIFPDRHRKGCRLTRYEHNG